MSTKRSAGRLRWLSRKSLIVLTVPLLALAAACGSGVESASRAASSESLTTTARPAKQYKFELIDVPGSVRTIVWDINDLGVAVGVFTDSTGMGHGFMRTRNGVQQFDFPGASSTTFLDVNNTGTAVGWYGDASGAQHGFKLSPDMTSAAIDFPGAANTYVGSINNRGDMVGSYGPTVDEGTGFLLQDGRFTTLADPPGAAPETNLPLGMNDLGTISGTFTDAAGAEHGFVLVDGTYTIVDPLGSSDGPDFALAKINDLGNAVGSNGVDEGFIVNARTGRFSTFSCPGGFAIRVRGINNRGQVTGGCRTGPGAPFVGFIATPVDD